MVYGVYGVKLYTFDFHFFCNENCFVGGPAWPSKWMSLDIKMNELLMPVSLWKTQADHRVPIQAYRITLKAVMQAHTLVLERPPPPNMNDIRKHYD